MPNGEAIKLLTMAGGGRVTTQKKFLHKKKLQKQSYEKNKKKTWNKSKQNLFQDLKLKKFLLRKIALHVSVRRLILSPHCHHVVHNPFKQQSRDQQILQKNVLARTVTCLLGFVLGELLTTQQHMHISSTIMFT